jgi:serine/threonine-protein kinase
VTPERWQKIKAVLEAVLELEAAQRTTFLDASCQGDAELRQEVESLLASEPAIGDFIETPVFRIRPDDGGPSLAHGQRVGAYRIVREIGRGGMGSVYLAERADEEFERRVALKVIRRGMDSEEIVRRFRSERQILAHLDHENIAKLLDGGTTEDGRPYFVMEYVEGRPIDEECDARKLSIRRRLELFQQVCSAVHFAHQNLVVHRDLKPGNILVTSAGVPKLLDFGIAKLLSPDQPFTLVDLRPMTPEYASPEQVRGEAITTASDVYSLGVLLYSLLTGRRPYRPSTGDPQSLAKAICEQNPPRPSSVIGKAEEMEGATRDGDARVLRRQLAGDLDNIVLKAMHKEPQRRYASVDQLSNDIGRHLQGLPVVARKDTLGYRAAKFVGRYKVGTSLAALILLLIVGSGIVVTILWRRAESEKTRAETVNAFLDDLFSSSNPSKSQGETITVREMLDRGVQKINATLKDQPEERAALMSTMGRSYRSLGFYEPARQLLETSLSLRRQRFGDEHPLVVQSMHNLAFLLHETGKYDDAESLTRKALEIQRRLGETRTLDYAAGLSNLGAILEDQEQLDEAEAFYKESLAIKRSLPDIDEADIAPSLNNLGKLYSKRGNYADAEKNLQEALAINRKVSPDRPDPDLAGNINNLASTLEDRGDLAKAETLYRQSLEMRRKLYGARHSSVAAALNNLAHVLTAEGQAAAAEPLYREAVSMAEETLGKEHPNRGVMLRNLASVLVLLGKASECEAKAHEALAIFRSFQKAPWRVADAESVLGSCLAAQGRFSEAEPLLLRSLPVLRKDSHPTYASEAAQRIVALYTAWGKPERAAEYRTSP